MNQLINALIKCQNSNLNVDLESFFKKAIEVFKIKPKDKEEEQEILIAINKIKNKFKIKEVKFPIFNSIAELKELINKNKNHPEIKYVNSFLEKILNEEINSDSLYEMYRLFNNENMLIKKLKIRISKVPIDILRRKTKKEGFLCLEQENNEEIDLSQIFNDCKLKEKDKKFLQLFKKDDELLKDREVALILGLTRQAVSKRRKRIIDKLRKHIK